MLLENEDFVNGKIYTNFIEKSGIVKELMLRPYLARKSFVMARTWSMRRLWPTWSSRYMIN